RLQALRSRRLLWERQSGSGRTRNHGRHPLVVSHEERIDTIRSLGYTPREAYFLELVAVHSGYFLRRQYSEFLGRKRGGTAAALIRKALQKGHVCAERSCDRTLLYHLRRRAFYERISEPDN